jgi:phospholipase A1/A2
MAAPTGPRRRPTPPRRTRVQRRRRPRALLTNKGSPPLVKFQVSLRFDILSFRNVHNWGFSAAYTQKSFWDLFNWDASSPFVESNYKPEGFFFYRPQRLERFREAELGVQHESNGLGEIGGVNQRADSRGWNAVFVEGRFGFRRERASDAWFFVTPGLRLWMPFAVSPELDGKVGHVAAWVDVDFWNRNYKYARVTGRLKLTEHNVEADLHYPLLSLIFRREVNAWFYVQGFYGEAERLITAGDTVGRVYAGISFE